MLTRVNTDNPPPLLAFLLNPHSNLGREMGGWVRKDYVQDVQIRKESLDGHFLYCDGDHLLFFVSSNSTEKLLLTTKGFFCLFVFYLTAVKFHTTVGKQTAFFPSNSFWAFMTNFSWHSWDEPWRDSTEHSTEEVSSSSLRTISGSSTICCSVCQCPVTWAAS